MATRYHSTAPLTMYFPTGKLKLVQIQATHATDTYTPSDDNRGHWWNDGASQTFLPPDETGTVKRDDLRPALQVRSESGNLPGRARLSGEISPPTEASSVSTKQGPGTAKGPDVGTERTIVSQGTRRKNLTCFLNR